jgi:hypothetical protein
MFFVVDFRDPDIWSQIPKGGLTLRIPIPASSPHSDAAVDIMSGGYGLEDLRPLLTPAERIRQRPFAERDAVDAPLEDNDLDTQLEDARRNGMEIVELKLERARTFPFRHQDRVFSKCTSQQRPSSSTWGRRSNYH